MSNYGSLRKPKACLNHIIINDRFSSFERKQRTLHCRASDIFTRRRRTSLSRKRYLHSPKANFTLARKRKTSLEQSAPLLPFYLVLFKQLFVVRQHSAAEADRDFSRIEDVGAHAEALSEIVFKPDEL